MRLLEPTLRDQDPGYIKVLLEQWGLDLPESFTLDTTAHLCQFMLDGANFQEYLDELPETSRQLLERIARKNGRVAYAELERDFGEIREMGPGKRDREKPWRSPVSPLEDLWYRGLIGRAFADTPRGPRELVYIPDDLLELIPISEVDHVAVYGEPGRDPDFKALVSYAAIDDATTLIAALRKQAWSRSLILARDPTELEAVLRMPRALALIATILLEIGILDEKPFSPHRERALTFLETSRINALRTLLLGWRDSQRWNDLQATPHIQNAADEWPNDPVATRAGILECLMSVPIGEWWNIELFVLDMRSFTPDFQRPGGDFESWYLQDDSGQFIRGFENWMNVEGALIRYILSGPLHWFGAVDLGSPSSEQSPQAFRRTDLSTHLFDEKRPIPDDRAEPPVRINADAKIMAPFSSSRLARYQLARISDWEALTREGYIYRISPASLEAAQRQGLNLTHILAILETASKDEIPPSVIKAITRWYQQGKQAEIREILILHVMAEEIIDDLQSHKSTSKYLGRRLSPTTIEVRKSNWTRLRDAAARRGLLISCPEV